MVFQLSVRKPHTQVVPEIMLLHSHPERFVVFPQVPCKSRLPGWRLISSVMVSSEPARCAQPCRAEFDSFEHVQRARGGTIYIAVEEGHPGSKAQDLKPSERVKRFPARLRKSISTADRIRLAFIASQTKDWRRADKVLLLS